MANKKQIEEATTTAIDTYLSGVSFSSDVKTGVENALIPSSVVHGQKTVSSAGTEEALGSSTALKSGVMIKALAANANNVYVGGNPVTSSTGYVLDAGEKVFVANSDLSNIYIDVDTNDDGVSYIGG